MPLIALEMLSSDFFWVFLGKSSEKFCCTSLKLSCTVAWSS